MSKILVLYYSAYGHIEKMAEAVAFYEDASYVRLKDVTLSYDLPQSLLGRTGGESLRLYVNGRNLWTKTEWSGLDPEFSNTNQRGTPLEKSVIAGINLRF